MTSECFSNEATLLNKISHHQSYHKSSNMHCTLTFLPCRTLSGLEDRLSKLKLCFQHREKLLAQLQLNLGIPGSLAGILRRSILDKIQTMTVISAYLLCCMQNNVRSTYKMARIPLLMRAGRQFLHSNWTGCRGLTCLRYHFQQFSSLLNWYSCSILTQTRLITRSNSRATWEEGIARVRYYQQLRSAGQTGLQAPGLCST